MSAPWLRCLLLTSLLCGIAGAGLAQSDAETRVLDYIRAHLVIVTANMADGSAAGILAGFPGERVSVSLSARASFGRTWRSVG
jgi:hypothetical protein